MQQLVRIGWTAVGLWGLIALSAQAQSDGGGVGDVGAVAAVPSGASTTDGQGGRGAEQAGEAEGGAAEETRLGAQVAQAPDEEARPWIGARIVAFDAWESESYSRVQRGEAPLNLEDREQWLVGFERTVAAAELARVAGDDLGELPRRRRALALGLERMLRLLTPKQRDRLMSAIVRAAELESATLRATGDLERALEVLEWPIELREDEIQAVFERERAAGRNVQSIDRSTPTDVLLSFVDGVFSAPVLSLERRALRAQLERVEAPALQRLILEPEFADWHLERFGPLDQELYERMQSPTQSESPALDWQIPGRFAMVAGWDMRRLPIELNASYISGTIATLVADTRALVELDALMARRWGGDWDVWIAEALTRCLNDSGQPPAAPLGPLFERLLASPALDGRAVLSELVVDVAHRSIGEPVLAAAVARAALKCDFDRTATLVAPWFVMQRVADNPSGNSRFAEINDFESRSELVPPLIGHADPDVRYSAAVHISWSQSAPVLDWAGSPLPLERERAVRVLRFFVAQRVEQASRPDDATLLAAAETLMDDPELRSRTLETFGRGAPLEWFERCLPRLETAAHRAELVGEFRKSLGHLRVSSQEVFFGTEALGELVRRREPPVILALLQIGAVAAFRLDDERQQLIVEAAIALEDPDVLQGFDSLVLRSEVFREPWFRAFAARIQVPDSFLRDHRQYNRVSGAAADMLERMPSNEERRRALELAIATGERSVYGAVAFLLVHKAAGGNSDSRAEAREPVRALFAPFEPSEMAELLVAISDAPILSNGYGVFPDWYVRLFDLPARPRAVARLVLEAEGPSLDLLFGAASMLEKNDPALRAAAGLIADRYVSAPAGSIDTALEHAAGMLRFTDANAALRSWLLTHPPGVETNWALRQQLYYWLDPLEDGALDLVLTIIDQEASRGTGVVGREGISEASFATAFTSVPERRAEAVGALIRALDLSSDQAWIGIAGRLAWPEFLPSLVRISDSAGGGATAALGALRRYYGEPAAMVALRNALVAESVDLRNVARNVLESWELLDNVRSADSAAPTEQEARDELFDMLGAEDEVVVAEAARALATLGAIEALPRLIGLLRDERAVVRTAVREAIDRLNALPPKED